MKIELEISEKNEATAFPWWVIIDPIQMLKPDVHHVAGMLTGPFFSRAEADCELLNRAHFSSRAAVYCLSGHDTDVYRKAIEAAKAGGLSS